MIIRDLEKAFTDELTGLYDFEEARNLAWLAISHVCRFNRIEYLGAKKSLLSSPQERSLYQILKDLNTGKPLQYVLGETEFYGLRLKVNPSVLIPRPETEELVDWIIKDAKAKNPQPGLLTMIDVGTGSGCIPIALKKNLPRSRVSGIDISGEAVKTAKDNSQLNNTEIHFYTDDIFDLKHPEIANGFFDVIVSNPPYVTWSEKTQMHQNVLEFEPHTALFVNDDDPLKFYRIISTFAKVHLHNKGKLFLEINENLGNETIKLLRESGFEQVELRKDLRGRNRMVKASIL